MNLTKNPFKKEKGLDFKSPDLTLPEKVSPIEKAADQKAEIAREKLERLESHQESSLEGDKPSLKSSDQRNHQAVVLKSKQLKEIELVLQEDLETIYFKMDEAQRRMFREEGERVAREIEAIIHTGRAIAVKVLEIIKRWLKLIPGVNKFFLEQEAKIKTDKIIKINTHN
ncbi:hypothetical protein A3B87_00530 [Candidatus Kuenenbacteria bacterium RIFCSPHIGHO2_02_FULL_39_13]|uniref:Uncharacterized protein n=1 Tax=Candidatus Kuenenbacteria bacterium RIFCSPHIGHO2_02_FULL_39_13 TaxID=1798561 RepID=A0A1F6FNZ9_9BACT|nr:MAG: hypothetical protein A3B87_00530 [Candidatus Kuenenbacteria bacterium RIFCSPHIGHO2_02_FULL_39_13]